MKTGLSCNRTMSSLTDDLIAPLVKDDATMLWAKVPMYCTGAQIVVTADDVTACGLSIVDVPGMNDKVAVIDIKDTDGLVFRNLHYTGAGVVTTQLPITTTREGRVLVNPPGILKDADVGAHQMRVFGEIKADSVVADNLVVRDVSVLNMQCVKDIRVLNNAVQVMRQDDSQFTLPISWDMIGSKPPLEATMEYLEGRAHVAQFNIDFLLNELTKVRADVASLVSAKAAQDQRAPPSSEDMSQSILQKIVAITADVSSPL